MEQIDEPEPGAIVRFSTGGYNFAAIRILRHGPDQTGQWFTTSSGDWPETTGWLRMVASWSEILRYADGLRIDRAVSWETIKEGRGPSSRTGIDWSTDITPTSSE